MRKCESEKVSTGAPRRLDDSEKGRSGEWEVYHINARLSTDAEDVGQMRIGKIWLVLRYCVGALGCRFRKGVKTFYYVPASPGRAALYRDWLVMLCCRPFFRRRIFHWHAAGLLEWLERDARAWERWLSHRLLGRPDLSIVLSEFNRGDGVSLRSRRVEVVPNGIPDPCPSFQRDVLPLRRERLRLRMQNAECRMQNEEGGLPNLTGANRGNRERKSQSPFSPVQNRQSPIANCQTFRVLYVGLCFSEKGLFDAVEGVRLANERSQGISILLTVAGSFWRKDEQARFERLTGELRLKDGKPQIEYAGFVSGEVKDRLFRECDCLCFPTFYATESFGLVVVEAMAYGMPVITTNWRMIPELLPDGYAGLVAPKSPEQIAAKLVDAVRWNTFHDLRDHYLRHFTVEEFWRKMKAVLSSV
ncbi:MAG: glycosyltransferase [Verrucomicrobia subdivision 3 bacterium]|nr:glycosyltransferase [Limisphaerales bacterium]